MERPVEEDAAYTIPLVGGADEVVAFVFVDD